MHSCANCQSLRISEAQTQILTFDTCQFNRHDGLVVVGQLVVHGHDDTVGHDGDDDDPVEGRPVDEPGHHLADRTGGGEEEEGGGTSLIRLILLLLSHLDFLSDLPNGTSSNKTLTDFTSQMFLYDDEPFR